jgi:hypothetical protein
MGRTAKKAAKSGWVEGAGRAGLVGKGVLYILFGSLAILVAVGAKDRLEDRQGTLQVVADQPLGRVLLVVLALLLAAYAAWRFVQAILDRDDEGEGVKALAKRVGYFARGVWYSALFAVTVSVIVGADEEGGSKQADRATAFVLGLPLGEWLVAGVGLAIIGAGLFNAYRAVTQKFRKKLDEGDMSKTERRGSAVVGVIGHAARFVIFSLIGSFLVKAAWQHDPKETVGLAGALSEVVQEDGGRVWLFGLAAALVCYGLYCFVQARYRDV